MNPYPSQAELDAEARADERFDDLIGSFGNLHIVDAVRTLQLQIDSHQKRMLALQAKRQKGDDSDTFIDTLINQINRDGIENVVLSEVMRTTAEWIVENS